ncbi:hypothetical protein [Acrocarpospora sp. B8E8]|uniref:hypothetical protein n=1 Tax=Acrocarpospora sp. B8E8 TaxID=3153572 RepID=UPI00325CB90C
MTGFFAELGKKVAERWLSLLLLPGFLLVAAWVAGVRLGHGNALGALDLAAWLTGTAAAAQLALAAAGVLAVSAGLGLAAAAGGVAIMRLWTARGVRAPLVWLTRRRERRWKHAQAEIIGAIEEERLAGLADLVNARNAICLVPSARPMWIGDRLRAVDQRVLRSYDLDLAGVWPRLWLVLPGEARTEIGVAYESLAAAARLMAWGLLYLPVAVFWWPAAIVALVTCVTAWVRARAAAETFGSLLESAIDLYALDLAAHLKLDAEGPLSRETGLAVTRLVRKDFIELTDP